jgi:pimeloyl-ACP methyl ester carboxylesterase
VVKTPSILASPPTFLLIHGAFHGGWCWRRVGDLLAATGARVFTPTLTGLGERAHLLNEKVGIGTFIDDTIGVIEAEELENIVLVGHSFGGAVISGVADRVPGRIAQLVYLDAIVPRSGHSALSCLPPETQEIRLRTARATPGGLTIPLPTQTMFDLPPGPGRDWVARHITPHPLASYTDPIVLDHPVGNGRPRLYIRCTDPVYPAVVPSYDRIKAEGGWTLVDIATGHDAMVSAPELLTELLLAHAPSPIHKG